MEDIRPQFEFNTDT
jgi:hypothetical protein